jgi:hypothetical protein
MKIKIKLNLKIVFSGHLNTNVCYRTADLYDSNEKYLQSACAVKKWLQHNGAQMYCQANGMDLIDISADESKTALIDFATVLFDERGLYYFYVKGRISGECQYISNFNGSFEETYGYCYGNWLYFFCGFKNHAI